MVTHRNSYENTSNDRGMPSYERIVEIEKATKFFMHAQYEQNNAFSKQLGEHSAILKNINEQLAGLTNEISNLQRSLDTTETYISNMSNNQASLIRQMAAKPEVATTPESKPAETFKTMSTSVATIRVFE